MTYETAVAELKARYNAGERRMGVSPEVFAGYQSGLIAMERFVDSTVTPDTHWLAFKDARVRVQPCE